MLDVELLIGLKTTGIRETRSHLAEVPLVSTLVGLNPNWSM